MSAPSVIPGWFSIRGAAEYTGFSVTSIRAAIDLGKFPTREVQLLGDKKTKPNIRIRREDLDAWIQGTNPQTQ